MSRACCTLVVAAGCFAAGAFGTKAADVDNSGAQTAQPSGCSAEYKTLKTRFEELGKAGDDGKVNEVNACSFYHELAHVLQSQADLLLRCFHQSTVKDNDGTKRAMTEAEANSKAAELQKKSKEIASHCQSK